MLTVTRAHLSHFIYPRDMVYTLVYDQVLLCTPGWPGMQYVDQADFELAQIPVSSGITGISDHPIQQDLL